VSASLTAPVAQLADQLAGLPGVVAVVLGGSRATGTHRPDSDWDLGLYYRESFDPGGLRLGHEGQVSGLGEWGPIMNGGAWLTIEDTPVDVLFRDLDRVERWHEDARQGRFEVLTQNGYIVGAPTYLPVGELALCRPLAGDVPRRAARGAPRVGALNEKRLIERAGLIAVGPLLASRDVDAIADLLGVEPLAAR
jgi:predicted nucleotidyltransferase